MTQEEFRRLPFLLTPAQAVEAMGYAPATLEKMVECGGLIAVVPKGAFERRFRKVQVAMMAGFKWDEEARVFRREPLLMKLKAVHVWTGYAESTVRQIAQAGGLRYVRLPGMSGNKFRKMDVAALLGLEELM